MDEVIMHVLALLAECAFCWPDTAEAVLCRRLEHAAQRGAAGVRQFAVDLELLACMRTLDDDRGRIWN